MKRPISTCIASILLMATGAVSAAETGSKADDPEFVLRFQREATTLAGLCHPNIVACHDAGTTEPEVLTPDQIGHLIREAGYEPVQRSTVYEEIGGATA